MLLMSAGLNMGVLPVPDDNYYAYLNVAARKHEMRYYIWEI